MKVLIVAAGSHGDVLPFIAIARELKRRGHTVRLYTNAIFEALARRADIDLAGIGSTETFLDILRDPDTNHPTRSLRVMAQFVRRFAQSAYDKVASDVEPGNTLLVGSTIAFTARFVAETHRVPVATIHLSPNLLRSLDRMPRFGPGRPLTSAPRLVKRLIWWLVDKAVVDPTLGAALNHHRAGLGLAPVGRYFDEWLHRADVVVGMFPEWFAERQPVWPSNLTLTGFPLYDQGDERPLPPEVEDFLANGPPPVGFTAGTANAAAQSFFAESVEACRRSSRRAIVLTEHADQVPNSLPAGMLRTGYVPFSNLLPRLSAFVHHGGIGTTSQAMRAGVPQLIRPLAHDQFDNSDRANRLGVSLEISSKTYRAENILAALDRLENDPAIRAACLRVAGWVKGNAVSDTCDAILRAAAFPVG
jgi:UDP:flavonoid glycosyltransferase YjiC (YdhE family)